MRHLLLALLLAVPAAADVAADGFYVRPENFDAANAAGADARISGLKDRRDYAVSEAKVTSQDNANTSFFVQVALPFDEALDKVRHVLVVGGDVFEQNGSGSQAGKTSWLDFTVAGRDKADAVAAYFKVKRTLRAHPGHRLRVSFVPKRSVYRLGESLVVTLRIENVGDAAVRFMDGGHNDGARDNQFVFHATGALPEKPAVYDFGGMAGIRELKPGEVFEKEVDMSAWFESQAGTHAIHGAWRLELRDGERLVWEDWATAEFTIRIGAK